MNRNKKISNFKMMNSKKIIFCFLLFITCLFQNVYGQSRTYYVDSQTGNDANSGSSPTTAWQSLDKVNSVTFQPGDRILFKTGSVWDDATHIPKGSGVAGSPIIIDAYGDAVINNDNKPRINADCRRISNIILPGGMTAGVSAGLILHNVSYWEVNNLRISNMETKTVENWWWHRDLFGVLIYAQNCGTMEHIYVRNMYIHDVTGYYPGYGHNCGRGIFAVARGGSSDMWEIRPDDLPTKFNDLRIENNHLQRIYREGITTWSFFNAGKNPATPPPGYPYAVPYRHTNVVIRGNLLEHIAGNAIISSGTAGALLEHNVVRGGAMKDYDVPSAGIWTYDSDNTIIQFNEVSGMMGMRDGQAYNIDYWTTNTIVQYNYSFNNTGGFLLLCSPRFAVSSGNVVRYNISQNDGAEYGWNRPPDDPKFDGGHPFGRVIQFYGGNTNTKFYNNIFYIGEGRGGYSVVCADHHAVGNGPREITFENNIFIVESPNMNRFYYEQLTPASTTHVEQFTWKNNVYIGAAFNEGTTLRDGVPDINQTGAQFLTDAASDYFYGAGNAFFGRETAIAAFTPKANTALANMTGQIIAEPEIVATNYRLANNTVFTPGPHAFPFRIWKLYNYNTGIDFTGAAVNINAPRQLGAIPPSATPPFGGLLPAPIVTVAQTQAGIEVTVSNVPGAQKYTLIYGKTHGLGYQAREVTKTAAGFDGKFVLDISGEGNMFFDEYFFTVCAEDASGKNGYFSLQKLMIIDRDGGNDTNPFYKHEVPTLENDPVKVKLIIAE